MTHIAQNHCNSPHRQNNGNNRKKGNNYNRDRLRNLCIETKSYFPEILQHVPTLADAVRETVMYTGSAPLKPINPNNRFDTFFRVVAGDTIDVAIALKQESFENRPPLVLNMASPFKPGGGWENGSMAQEEVLFYRSTYDLSLSDPFKLDNNRKWHYPIPYTGAIYSPNVYVFRGNAQRGFPLWNYEDCVFIDFVAVAAIKNPTLVCNRLSPNDANLTKKKIRTILRVAYENYYEDLVLGALGCGAFHNPPQHIAELFYQVFREEEFLGRFKCIVFAILDTRGEPNYEIFKNVISPLNDIHRTYTIHQTHQTHKFAKVSLQPQEPSAPLDDETEEEDREKTPTLQSVAASRRRCSV